MTDFEDFEGGVAVAYAPEEEKEAAAAAAEEKPEAAAENKAAAAEAEDGYDVDLGYDMEWEVETVPPEEPEMETVTEEVIEEYYEPGYNRGYGQGYGGYGQNYNRGYGQGYGSYGQGQSRYGFYGRRAARRFNKHVFTWLLSFVLGIYGADRFARGQIGLGMLKLLTFGGFGFWYLYDAAMAIIMSYGGPYRNSDEVTFDQFGQYYY